MWNEGERGKYLAAIVKKVESILLRGEYKTELPKNNLQENQSQRQLMSIFLVFRCSLQAKLSTSAITILCT